MWLIIPKRNREESSPPTSLTEWIIIFYSPGGEYDSIYIYILEYPGSYRRHEKSYRISITINNILNVIFFTLYVTVF